MVTLEHNNTRTSNGGVAPTARSMSFVDGTARN
jgi:hypothetical protein